jgi:ribosome biogenesis GTPase / thiamine phosphate phosphatase
MTHGLITKLKAGTYTVAYNQSVYQCKPRGVFRHQNIDPRVGDKVILDDTLTTITEVLDRHSILKRPAIANVDQAFLVMSVAQPELSEILLDRFLVLVEEAGIEGIIVLTKIDLMDDASLKTIQKKMAYYETLYPVFYVSKHDPKTILPLKALFKDKITVFAGQTGAGKSSLLNHLSPELNLATQEISKALGRGKHTTRHVELWHLYDGFIADTPGFSKLEFEKLDKANLKYYFKDFKALASECKFRECNHLKEPGCAVKKAVEEGLIPNSRYESYEKIYQEVKDQETY